MGAGIGVGLIFRAELTCFNSSIVLSAPAWHGGCKVGESETDWFFVHEWTAGEHSLWKQNRTNRDSTPEQLFKKTKQNGYTGHFPPRFYFTIYNDHLEWTAWLWWAGAL